MPKAAYLYFLSILLQSLLFLSFSLSRSLFLSLFSLSFRCYSHRLDLHKSLESKEEEVEGGG